MDIFYKTSPHRPGLFLLLRLYSWPLHVSSFRTIHILFIPQNPAKSHPINEVISDFSFIYNWSLRLT